jgi:hypothetical protein
VTGGAGVRHGLDPPLVPLAHGNGVEVVDAIASAAFAGDETSVDEYRTLAETPRMLRPGGVGAVKAAIHPPASPSGID